MKFKELHCPDLKVAAQRTKTKREVIQLQDEISPFLKDYFKGKLYYIRTYGCQANVRDSEYLMGYFELMGMKETKEVTDASLIVLNTCAIRENAEDKLLGELGHLKSATLANNPIIAVGGCSAQEEHMITKIKKFCRHVAIVFGTHNISSFPSLLEDHLRNKNNIIDVESKEGEIYENYPSKRTSKYKAFVNIMFGCDKFCTYCIVPYTRGTERSRSLADILSEVKELQAQGYQEVTLLGQNVNAYGKDLGLDLGFGDLLKLVAETGIPRVRFMTSHPWDFTEKMFEVMATYPNIMPYIHLPVQSGSNDILRRMGRRYTSESYKELVNKLRSIIKGVSLTTDIIVGFPNETDEDFKKTLELTSEVGFDNAYTFIYSARVGTPAARIKDTVSDATKHIRFNELLKIVEKKAEEIAETYVGNDYDVLIDGPSSKNPEILEGYTETMHLVHLKGPDSIIGKIVKVHIEESHTYSLTGCLING